MRELSLHIERTLLAAREQITYHLYREQEGTQSMMPLFYEAWLSQHVFASIAHIVPSTKVHVIKTSPAGDLDTRNELEWVLVHGDKVFCLKGETTREAVLYRLQSVMFGYGVPRSTAFEKSEIIKYPDDLHSFVETKKALCDTNWIQQEVKRVVSTYLEAPLLQHATPYKKAGSPTRRI